MRRILSDRPLTGAERSARYRANHPEFKAKHTEYERKRRRLNPELARLSHKRWREKDKQKYKEYTANYYKENVIKYMISRAKQRAKRKGIEFNLKDSDIKIPEKCPVLGIPLSPSAKRVSDGSPSIDRIYYNKGYVPENIIVVSHRVNTIKSNATPEELMRVAEFYMKLKKRI